MSQYGNLFLGAIILSLRWQQCHRKNHNKSKLWLILNNIWLSERKVGSLTVTRGNLDEKERGNIYISCDGVTLCHKISLVFVSNNMCYTGNLQHKLAPPCLIVLLIWALSHTLAAKITLICTYYISGQNLIWNSMLLFFFFMTAGSAEDNQAVQWQHGYKVIEILVLYYQGFRINNAKIIMSLSNEQTG